MSVKLIDPQYETGPESAGVTGVPAVNILTFPICALPPSGAVELSFIHASVAGDTDVTLVLTSAAASATTPLASAAPTLVSHVFKDMPPKNESLIVKGPAAPDAGPFVQLAMD